MVMCLCLVIQFASGGAVDKYLLPFIHVVPCTRVRPQRFCGWGLGCQLAGVGGWAHRK